MLSSRHFSIELVSALLRLEFYHRKDVYRSLIYITSNTTQHFLFQVFVNFLRQKKFQRKINLKLKGGLSAIFEMFFQAKKFIGKLSLRKMKIKSTKTLLTPNFIISPISGMQLNQVNVI